MSPNRVERHIYLITDFSSTTCWINITLLSTRNVRQELAILSSINHVNIIRFFGVCNTPFAILLELAPMGALDDRCKEYRRSGKRINPVVIQKSLQQVISIHQNFSDDFQKAKLIKENIYVNSADY